MEVHMEKLDLLDLLTDALNSNRLGEARRLLEELSPGEIRLFLDRMPSRARAIGFRLLHKDLALAVFEQFSPTLQKELIETLGEDEVSNFFDELDPDDRVE